MNKARILRIFLILELLFCWEKTWAQPLKDPEKYKENLPVISEQDVVGQKINYKDPTSYNQYLKLNGPEAIFDANNFEFGLKRSPASGLINLDLNRFIISCDQEIKYSQCANQISHYSLSGRTNELVELATSFSCSQFNWFDQRNKLDSSTCESRLNCATTGLSRSGLCVPDRRDLEKAIPAAKYNNMVGHAILRNLSVGEEAARIQKLLSLGKSFLKIEVPKKCEKLMSPEKSGCSRESLASLSESYTEYYSYLAKNDSDLEKKMKNDPILKQPTSSASIIDSVNRIRELSITNHPDYSNELRKTEDFINSLTTLYDENKEKSEAEIAKIIVQEFKGKSSRYAELRDGTLSEVYLGNKISKLENVLKNFRKALDSNKDPVADRLDILKNTLKNDFAEAIESNCEEAEIFNLANACMVLESKNDRTNKTKQFKFDTFKHRSIFTGNSLDFIANSQKDKAAFFIRACENTEMQQTFIDPTARTNGSDGISTGAEEELSSDRKKNVVNSFGTNSGSVETKTTAVSTENSDTDDSMISTQIANAFGTGNNPTTGTFNSLGTNYLASDASANAINELEAQAKKNSEESSSDRLAADKTSQGFESIQKELEGLKSQLAQQQQQQQKNNDAQKSAAPATDPVAVSTSNKAAVDKIETENLKRRIAELENEVARPKESKSSTFNSFDDSVWSKSGSAGASRAIASETIAAAGASNGARASAAADQSNTTTGNSALNTGPKPLLPGGATNAAGGLQNLSLVKYENQSMVVLPQSATTQDVENKILELRGKPFFIENADGSYTYVVTDLDKEGKPVLGEDGKPKYMVKKVASDKVSPVKARGVAAVKNAPKVRELKELKDPATRKRELDELLKKTKK